MLALETESADWSWGSKIPFFFFYGGGNQIQGIVHTGQVLYYELQPQPQNSYFFLKSY
jgi:hypothetical protein